MTAEQHDISEHYEDRFNVAERVGVDLQALYDKSIEARMLTRRGRDDVRVARLVLGEERRKVARAVLAETRPFAARGDLGFIADTEQHPVPRGDDTYSTFSTMDVAAPKLRDATVFLPHDWIQSSNAHPSRLVPGWALRGKYVHSLASGYSGIIGSSSPEQPGVEEGVGTMVHELVHRAEATRDGEWAFYTSRVSPGLNRRWDDLKKLRDLTGNDNYTENELARPDDFVNAYSGKTYGDDMDSSWEILSMGVEDMVTGEHGIIAQDEDYRHFVFGALALL